MIIHQMIKKIIPLSLYAKMRFLKRALVKNQEMAKWENSEKKDTPPHIVKQLAILDYKKKFNIDILVETGTYLGDMVYAQLLNFKKIISIELDRKLYSNAKKIFKKFQHVEIIQGDSGVVLRSVLPKLNEKAIFWLDGHYSGGITAKGKKECPIYEELETILKSDLEHVLLIDDANGFVGSNDYPTIEELVKFIKSKKENYNIEIKDNIIRVTLNYFGR